MNERKSKNVVIIALCLTLIFMGVGFAALSAQLNVTTTATVSGTWDVHFSSADIVAAQGNNQGSITSNTFDTITEDSKTTSLTVGLKLVKPGDFATFTVTAKNFGSIKAILSNIEGSSDFTNADTDVVLRTIKVGETEITDLTNPGINALAQNNETTFTITYTLNPAITSDGTLKMPAFTEDTDDDGINDAYVVTDTLHFNYNQA